MCEIAALVHTILFMSESVRLGLLGQALSQHARLHLLR